MTDWTEIEVARARAHAKHGENSIEGITADDPRWLSILGEEGGEASEATLLAWNALLQARLGRVAHEQTYDATGSLRAELVDVIAVASAWLDALDAQGDDTLVHACPVGDASVTPCCGRSPFELLFDRMTLDPKLVTCPGIGS